MTSSATYTPHVSVIDSSSGFSASNNASNMTSNLNKTYSHVNNPPP